MSPHTAPLARQDQTELQIEFRKYVLWTIAACVVGGALGWISVMYFNTAPLIPRQMLSVTRFITGGAMPGELDVLMGGALCGAVIVGIPVYIVHAWRLLAPAFRR